MKFSIILFWTIFIANSCSKNEFSVAENVPDKTVFDKELKIELDTKYSNQNGKKLTLDWELLSNKPLKKQNSYPEYFVWIKMNKDNKVVNQGLVKLIVKEKKFHSIAFMNDQRIQAAPNDARREFPLEILDRIDNK